jgi:hypothetical protein
MMGCGARDMMVQVCLVRCVGGKIIGFHDTRNTFLRQFPNQESFYQPTTITGKWAKMRVGF